MTNNKKINIHKKLNLINKKNNNLDKKIINNHLNKKKRNNKKQKNDTEQSIDLINKNNVEVESYDSLFSENNYVPLYERYLNNRIIIIEPIKKVQIRKDLQKSEKILFNLYWPNFNVN